MDIDMGVVAETSASFLSNVFRYKMIAKTGAIWIDCDAYCHRPFPDGQEYIYAGHGMRGALNCGVVGMPQTCRLMDELLDYYDNLPDYPAWWGNRQKKKMDKLRPVAAASRSASTRPNARPSARRPLPTSRR